MRSALAVAGAVITASALLAQSASAQPFSGKEKEKSGGGQPATSAAPQRPGADATRRPDRFPDPDTSLGKGWRTSDDRAVTLAADVDGLHVMTADSKDAYAWHSVTTLSEPGITTDLWVGNYCTTDRSHAVVVYAPRTFSNRQETMERGAFTAFVDLDTGATTKLPVTASLAYFDPTCDTVTHTAVITQFNGGRTKLISISAAGKPVSVATVDGEVTSATPTAKGLVGALGHQVVGIAPSGRTTGMATTDSVPYAIHPDADGGVAFLDQTKTAQHAKRVAGGKVSTLATGPSGSLGLSEGDGGHVFLSGNPTRTAALPKHLSRITAGADADISTRGAIAVDSALTPAADAQLALPGDAARPEGGKDQVTVQLQATATGKKGTFGTAAGAASPKAAAAGNAASPALAPPSTAKPAASASASTSTSTSAKAQPETADQGSGTVQPDSVDIPSHDTVDDDRWCSIPRNDPYQQALQPTPNQVEWAVDMAIRGKLTDDWITQGGWRTTEGLGTVDPQGTFPLPPLNGGGRIPASVLLGILAQESNLWQAEGGAVPGQTSSPLASANGFYGHPYGTDLGLDYWTINWADSDCGYGIGQVTDGMRLASHPKGSVPALPADQQKDIALDYTYNIAMSARILAQKWNELHTAGQTLTINNDSASGIENWFAAVWNYNEGFNPPGGDATNWGLGWYNNPANPIYKASRKAFLDTTQDAGANADAAHPADWPYEERVMGFAAWSIDTNRSYSSDGSQDAPGASGYSTAGFMPASWPGGSPQGDTNRSNVKPPLDTFCNQTANDCLYTSPPTCETDGKHDATCDPKHWWHQSNATWKTDCPNTCGMEGLKYVTLRSEPGRGHGGPYGNPDCTMNNLPSGSLIIDSDPDYRPTLRDDCSPVSADSGSFEFTFQPDGVGNYEARGDLHQMGGGFNSHFWYAHSRSEAGAVFNVNNSTSFYNPSTGLFTGSEASLFDATPIYPSGNMAIEGDWKLSQPLSGYARVMVHIPDTGMNTKQAVYTVHTGSETTNRVINGQYQENTWVSLGAILFGGSSWQGVALTNYGFGATADNDIAWDAVAFVPLAGKPHDSVVQLGDSYSSGTGVGDYYTNSDTGPHVAHGSPNPPGYDACLRSKNSWIRLTTLPDTTATIASRNDSWDGTLDYHSVACNGATTKHASQDGSYGEIPQLYSGFLNPDTTLVTFTMGGNDAGFSGVIEHCVTFGCPSDDDVKSDIDDAVANDQTLLERVHAEAPNARIVILGYPVLFDTDAISCVDAAGDVDQIASWGGYLNVGLQDMVAHTETDGMAVFWSPVDAFGPHLLCDAHPGLHSLTETPSDDIASDPQFALTAPSSLESYHPNASGAGYYRDALEHILHTIQ